VTAFADAVLAEVARPLEDRRVVRLVCSRGHTIDRVVLAGHVPSWDPGALPSVFLVTVSPARKRTRRTVLSRAYAPLGGTLTVPCDVAGCDEPAASLDPLRCAHHDEGTGVETYSQLQPTILRCPAARCRFEINLPGPSLAERVARAIVDDQDSVSLGTTKRAVP
jgi:hypothetical protein